jgi:hypothetical protein
LIGIILLSYFPDCWLVFAVYSDLLDWDREILLILFDLSLIWGFADSARRNFARVLVLGSRAAKR